MNAQYYRINRSTMVVLLEDDYQSMTAIPEGAIVVAESQTLKNKFVEAVWDERRVLMLTRDIRSNGENVWMADA